ncbi:MAG: polyprenyl synthetase family protein [Geminicoccaceae bacterium]
MTSLPPIAVEIARELDALMDELLRTSDRSLPAPVRRLYEAMRHSALAGGKRVRPVLASLSAQLFDVPPARALRVGAAIELLHTYTLIHDDLPAMDDALERRGRTTLHRAYDEATAILAGDALQALAFSVLSDAATTPDAEVRLELIGTLAEIAGPRGICGGQAMDLAMVSGQATEDQICHMELLKTGVLIAFSCRAGAILGRADAEQLERLDGYGRALGLAFQIKDDLIDVTGTAATAGKDLGRDQAQSKATLVSLRGVEAAERSMAEARDQAVRSVEPFLPKSQPLIDIAHFVTDRNA